MVNRFLKEENLTKIYFVDWSICGMNPVEVYI